MSRSSTATAAAAAPRSPLRDVLQSIADVLLAEQDAIRHLDASRLDVLTGEKDRLAAALADAWQEPRPTAAGDAAGLELRTLTTQVRALAHANRLLLDDAVALLGGRLGVADPGVYDARARRVTATRAAITRAL